MELHPMRILSLPVDNGGCGWYRVRQPLAILSQFTGHDAQIIDKSDENVDTVMLKGLSLADIVVLRPGAEGAMEFLRGKPEFEHLKWVMDIDDNVELVSPYSSHYKEYGVTEYYDKNIKKWLWKDGERGFDLKKNTQRLRKFTDALSEMDLITVTTEKLAEHARKYNKNVAIVPNYVDLRKWWPIKNNNEQLRVFWSGGSSHYEDIHSIKKPLNDLMRKYQFKLVFAGTGFDGIIDEENKRLVEKHAWVPFEAHSYRSMALTPDIFIIPLKDTPFNQYKSSIKLYESGAMGIPAVVSNVLPYKVDIEDGYPCMPYNSPETFYNDLERLLIEKETRDTMGANARRYVEENFDATKKYYVLEDAFRSIITE